MEQIDILYLIKLIRDSFKNSIEVYTKGSCVKFCMILKYIFPKGKILYDCNHAIFELNNRYFDISGEVEKENHIPIEEYGLMSFDLMTTKWGD